jgi:hypothetical protein
VLIAIDTGATRAETVLTSVEAQDVASLLAEAATRACHDGYDVKARRVGDRLRESLYARILLVKCPACRAVPGSECTIGKTPHADRRTAAVQAGVVSP